MDTAVSELLLSTVFYVSKRTVSWDQDNSVILVKKSEQLKFVIEGDPVTLPGRTVFFPGYILDSRFWHLRNQEFLPPETLLFMSVKNSRCCLCVQSR